MSEQKEKYYFQQGGATHMPNRFYVPNATPFKPCNCGHKSEQKGGSIGLPNRYFNPHATPFKTCNCDTSMNTQIGGNLTHAPMNAFKQGAPLQYNYELNQQGGPVFDSIKPSPFW